jgi:ribonucleoside-diphosphate reductase alpha chain
MHGINIDFSRDSLFDELGIKRLKESYMKDDEKSPQERFAFVSKAFSSNPEHAQRLYDYSSKHWLSYSTPILSFGRNKRGLPISCYLNLITDTAEGLVDNLSETNWLSMMGGGVGVHVGIRGADDKSVGVMPHLKTYDASSLAYRQGRTRRGSYAAYLDISHPDIIQFLEMRKPTGDQNMRTLNLNHGINVSDEFMEIIERCMLDPNADDSWHLKQPNTGATVETISAKDLWMRILEMRMQTGEPYLWFIDTANEGLPDYQKKMGLKNNGSNLCLTGDTIIDVKSDIASEPISIRLDHFIEKFELGYFTDPLVKTFLNGEVVWSKVSDAAKTADVTELYEIETPGGRVIRCTGDHKIYTKNRGYVEARLLEETDVLLEL